MAEKRELQQAQEGGQLVGALLTPNERAIVSEIASLDEPHSQRALVLLALDEGATQISTGERAGLSSRQVRYWRDKFLKQRLGIFPDDLLVQVPKASSALDVAASETEQEQQFEAVVVDESSQAGTEEAQADEGESKKKAKAQKDEKAKKPKDGKKKKDKKDKKDKKAKKGKKPKKRKKSGKAKKKKGRMK